MLNRWGPVAAYMGLIFYESSQVALPSGVERIWDKLLHVAGYAPLAWLCVRALTDVFRRAMTVGTAAGAWLLAVAYGITDEWHQSFVPLRQMDAADLVADGAGAAIAVITCLVWLRGRESRWAAASRLNRPAVTAIIEDRDGL